MPVLPELKAVLERVHAAERPDESLPVSQRRAQIHAGIDAQGAHLADPVPEVAHADHRVPVEGGEIAVRVYHPGGGRTLPGHVYVHGGGWWLGTLDQSDVACRRIAAAVGCAVVTVDHRLAPEHPYPVPAEDCYAALTWVAGHAGELGIDPARLSIGGVSSGANLAAASALMARDRHGPPLAAQLLDIPCLDLTMSRPSIERYGNGFMLSRERLAAEIAGYCPPAAQREAYASPLLADDLRGLPPTLVATAEYDLLRDDGEHYVTRLREAGVAAGLVCWEGHIHGSLAMTRLVASAHDWHERGHAFLREHLRTHGG